MRNRGTLTRGPVSIFRWMKKRGSRQDKLSDSQSFVEMYAAKTYMCVKVG
jgi:hypothetical protein